MTIQVWGCTLCFLLTQAKYSPWFLMNSSNRNEWDFGSLDIYVVLESLFDLYDNDMNRVKRVFIIVENNIKLI